MNDDDNRTCKTDDDLLKESETGDSDKSFESCINSDAHKDDENDDDDGDDDDNSSVKSFHSCSNNKNNSNIDGENTIEKLNEDAKEEEEDDDDDIRPGSCRENPSSDEDGESSWSDENGQWIYDSEFVAAQRSHGSNSAPNSVSESATDNIIDKNPKETRSNPPNTNNNNIAAAAVVVNSNSNNQFNRSNNNNRRNNQYNPTFIPTNGRFFMHDLRLDDDDDRGGRGKSLQQQSIDKPIDKSISAGNFNNFPSNSRNKNRGKENRFDNNSAAGDSVCGRWSHDLFRESEQRALSQSELIDKYGGGDNRSRYRSSRKHHKSNKRSQIGNNQYNNDYYYYYDYYNNDYYGNYHESNNRYYYPYNSRRSNNNNNRYNQYRYYPRDNENQYSAPTKYSDIRITVDVGNRSGARSIKSVANNNDNNKSRRPLKTSKPDSSINNNTNNNTNNNNRFGNKINANKDSNRPIDNSGDGWEASAPGDNVPDVIGEMPPLTEAEMSRLQWRQQQQSSVINNKPIINKQQQQQQTAPRFSRDKPSHNNNPDNQSRSMIGNSHVPKRYSEVRNHHRQATPDGAHVDHNNSNNTSNINNQSIPAPINYVSQQAHQQQSASIGGYHHHLNNLILKAPLAVGGTHVAGAGGANCGGGGPNSNAPPQLVSLGPLFGGDAHALSHPHAHHPLSALPHHPQQQQYYVYLSPAAPAAGSRLNQYSPAFTPSYPPAGALYHHPPQPHPQHHAQQHQQGPVTVSASPSSSAGAVPQLAPRPVLGKS